MSINNLRDNNLLIKHTSNTSRFNRKGEAYDSESDVWVRNPSWTTLPSVISSDQKLVGLYAIFPSESNFIAFTCAGNYTVDWGDGSSENVSSGVTAYHNYDYNDVDLNNTNAPVTFQDIGDTVTRNSHGYTDGMKISFYEITSTTGIVADQTYYVINATTNTFQLSLTKNGSVITLTTDGSGYILPYKLAVVTITPQGGSNLTSINLHVAHNQSGLSTGYPTGWLDLKISGPNLTTGTSLTIASVTGTVRHVYLESCEILNIGSCTSFSGLFALCFSLQNVIISATTTAITIIANMFYFCEKIRNIPLFDTSAVTNFNTAFQNCGALKNIPQFNTVAATSMNATFINCYTLITVPLFNTALVTNFSQMFQGCSALRRVPLFNTTSATNMSLMFSGCYNLEYIPLFNTASVTNMSGMFTLCTSIKDIPLINTSLVTNCSTMFQQCYSLQSIPLINTAAVTNCTSMFQSCYSLQTIPAINTSAAVNMSNMFNSCFYLETIPMINTSKVTAMNGMFNSCYNLKTIPYLETGNVTTMALMFFTCYSLSNLPRLNTVSVTTFANTFQALRSLTTIPAMNVASATTILDLTASSVNVTDIKMTSINANINFTSCRLSTNAIQTVFNNLLPTTTAKTITISSNWGAPTPISKTSSGTTSGSTTVTMANTANLAVGMEITGTGISDAVAVTFQDTGDTVTRNSHGIANNTLISFATITSTTGISRYTPYYVINTTTNTFQISDTLGGSAKTLTTDGSGTALYGTTITNINTNVSVTLSIPASATGTITASAAVLKRSLATMRGWTVSG